MTDHYNLCKQAFMTKARTMTDFIKKDYQVTDDDADVNRGAQCYMIFRPGPAPITPFLTRKILTVEWNLIFDMQVKFKAYKESWTLFENFRTAILNKFVFTNDYLLPGVQNVDNVMILANQSPGQKPPDVPSPNWLGQTMTAVITQQITRIHTG